MFEAVKKVRDELVELTQQLIRIRSFTGDERELAELILRKLREFDVDEAFIDRIGNVIGVVYGDVAGPSILLNGHLDVVPEGTGVIGRVTTPLVAKLTALEISTAGELQISKVDLRFSCAR